MRTSPPDWGGDDVPSLSVRPVLHDRITMMTCYSQTCPDHGSSRREFVL